MRLLALLSCLALISCDVVEVAPPSGGAESSAAQPVADPGPRVSQSRARANFQAVVARVEPVAERQCRRRIPGQNCDFRIIIDGKPGSPPNAYQTLDKDGRPVIGFTLALIADARNQDELAFILGHEAAHHIEGHIPESQQSALSGALLGTVLATIGGLEGAAVETAGRIGATVGSRSFSKQFELEADRLGTIIAARAGFDPVRGAAFFQRIPDPGDRFLGTHPQNADRIKIVRQTAAGL